MKYQKSILKIYEILVKNSPKEFIIEEIIKEAKVGRTSGFDAIKWLKKNNLISVELIGKQKSVKLLLNDAAVNFKSFLDSFGLKEINKEIQFEINLFSYLAYRHINAIFLFGSALSSKSPNDIDLLIVCDTPEKQEKLNGIRKLVENVCDIPINIHFSIEADPYEIIQKLIIYNKSCFINLIRKADKSLRLKLQYTEALYDINSLINNISDAELTGQLFQRLATNLAYCNCWLQDKINVEKADAIKEFENDYMSKIKNFNKLDNVKKLNIMKKIANGIGQKIFV
ncbi:hypothetical protein HYS31_03480 [Candidatus Woesearchaeota archaeon]|nr:hypothetical protein [Candidatus Woesearchaeota archaeon]